MNTISVGMRTVEEHSGAQLQHTHAESLCSSPSRTTLQRRSQARKGTDQGIKTKQEHTQIKATTMRAVDSREDEAGILLVRVASPRTVKREHRRRE